MLTTIEKMPDSPPGKLHLKDYLKGAGLLLLLMFTDAIPSIAQYLTAHDFGTYNDLVKAIFFIVTWFIQRYIKNNTSQFPISTNPNSYEDKEAP